jgi:hypothetical protein
LRRVINKYEKPRIINWSIYRERKKIWFLDLL